MSRKLHVEARTAFMEVYHRNDPEFSQADYAKRCADFDVALRRMLAHLEENGWKLTPKEPS